MKRFLLFALLLAACTDSEENWKKAATAWCGGQQLDCAIEYVRDGVGIVQPRGVQGFSLRCEGQLCIRDAVPGPPPDTYIYMPTYSTPQTTAAPRTR